VGDRIGSLIIQSDGSNNPNVISLSGIGLDSLPEPVIASLSPNARAIGATGVTLQVNGTGFSSLSIIRWAGADRPTTYINNSTLRTTLASSDFVTMGTVPVSVFNPAPGGGLSNSVEFTVYRATTLTAKDLIYDRVGSVIYASIAGSSPNLPNTLTIIEPGAGTFGPSTNIGSDPGKLAISSDSQWIYVGLDGSAQVRPFNTVSQTAGTAFVLGNDSFGPFFAEDIAISPGNSGTIAVSRRSGMGTPRHKGVAVYDNGVMRPTQTADHTGSNAIEFPGSPSTLYGYNNESTESGFRTMSVSPSGVTVTNVTQNLITGIADIQFEGGRIYASTGRVIDPVNRTLLGTFSLSLPLGGEYRGVAVDAEQERAFFLVAIPGSVSVHAFNVNTFAPTGSITLTGLGPPSIFGSLIRWGDNGLAFRSGTQVFTLRIPPSWVPDRTPSVTVSPNSARQGHGNLTVAVVGKFTHFAQGELSANLGAGVTLNEVVVTDATHATMSITIAPGAIPGPRQISISTGEETISATFTVVGLSGPVTSWGSMPGQSADPSGMFKSIAAGDTFALAIRKDGALAGWGLNANGVLSVPAGTFTSIAAGSSHGLAIRTDGTLAAWGNNTNGQTNVPGGTFIAVAAGTFHSVAIRSDGTLAAWGSNNFGQLDVPSGTFKAIAAGQAHSLAIRTDGTLVAWGSNSHGQTDVPSGTFTAIAAGFVHSLAIRTDGTLAGWGGNTWGQIDVPVGSFTAVAARENNSLAIRNDGTVAKWGDSSFGNVAPTGKFRAIGAGAFFGVGIEAISTAIRDFNGDGASDLLWRNTNGTVGAWLMDGLGILQTGEFGTIPLDWTIAGTGDLNGDGKSDIVWRHVGGTVAVWLMDGLVLAQGAAFGTIPNTWTIAGTGDLNGDGKTDIVWRNNDGTVAVWLMDGLVLAQGAAFGTIPNTWTIGGIGDLNGDGKSDIVWRNNDGTVAVWLMNGLTFQGAAFGTIPMTWTISGVGDLNGDEKSDIVWRNNDGTVAVWLMDGTVLAQGAAFGTISATWTLEGLGDLNRDGMTDLVWRNVDGTVGAWLMNGPSVLQAAGFGAISADWILQSSK
jgi:hypothetical protein